MVLLASRNVAGKSNKSPTSASTASMPAFRPAPDWARASRARARQTEREDDRGQHNPGPAVSNALVIESASPPREVPHLGDEVNRVVDRQTKHNREHECRRIAEIDSDIAHHRSDDQRPDRSASPTELRCSNGGCDPDVADRPARRRSDTREPASEPAPHRAGQRPQALTGEASLAGFAQHFFVQRLDSVEIAPSRCACRCRAPSFECA